MTVSGNTDPTIANYVLSFDIKGSQAASVQLGLQSWVGQYFGGAQNINVNTSFVLNAAHMLAERFHQLGQCGAGLQSDRRDLAV